MKSLLAFIALIFLSDFCFSIGLTAPYGTGSAMTLPRGVRNLRVTGITGEFANRYNDFSQPGPIAEPFVQDLTYGRLLKAEKDKNLVNDVEALLLAKGVKLNDVAGRSTAEIISRATVTAPILAYGITDRWSVAVTAPIVYTNISVATGFVATPQLNSMVDSFAQKSLNKTKLVESKLKDVIATEITNKGYEPLVNQENNEVGDLSLFSRVNVYQGKKLSVTLGQFITAPTGRQFSVNKIVDPAPGDGQWDFGMSATFNYKFLGGKITLYNDTLARWQFAHNRPMRIPIDTVERLSSEIDYNTYRKLGDIYQTSMGAMFQMTRWLGAGLGYQIGYKEKDIYRGTVVTDKSRYDALSFETEQFMQAGIWQLNLSSLQAFRAKRFPVPFSWSVNFSRIFQGRNIRTDDLWSTDLAIFF